MGQPEDAGWRQDEREGGHMLCLDRTGIGQRVRQPGGTVQALCLPAIYAVWDGCVLYLWSLHAGGGRIRLRNGLCSTRAALAIPPAIFLPKQDRHPSTIPPSQPCTPSHHPPYHHHHYNTGHRSGASPRPFRKRAWASASSYCYIQQATSPPPSIITAQATSPPQIVLLWRADKDHDRRQPSS